MRLFDFTSVKLSLYLIIGILVGHYFNQNLLFCAITLIVLLIVLGFLKWIQKRNTFPFFGVFLGITTSFLGVFVVTLSNPLSYQNHYSKFKKNKESVFRVKVAEVMKSTTFSDRYAVNVKQLDDHSASGKLLLSFPLDSTQTKFRMDDEFLFVGKVSALKPPLNPHQFDYKNYLQKQGIYHQAQLKKSQVVSLENPSKTLVGLASNFREGIINKLKTYDFGHDELGVIQALVLGKRDDISETTYNDYKNAGAVHILAVSGLHIGILLLLLQYLLKPLEFLPKGNHVKSVVVIVLLWAFALLAGLSPSVIRAVTMFSFLAYAMNLNRPTNKFNIIALSIFFILLKWPMFLFQVGFQMSYAAVIAIVWIYPKLQRFWYPKNWLVRKVWQLLSVSVAAQLGVLPISLFYFHQFPALFFISNLVVVPFLGIILGIGVLVVVLASIEQLPSFLVTVYNFLIEKMNGVIGWVAKQEGFVFRDIPFDTVQLVLGYTLIFGLVLSLSKHKFKNVALLLTALIGLSGWAMYLQWHTQNQEKLLLVHQTRNSILFHQKKRQLSVLTNNFQRTVRIINDFAVAERIKKITVDSIQNSYRFDKKSIFIMDSIEVQPIEKQLDYLILTQSPKINLERLLDSIHPNTIIADGSNYRSYVNRWKKTCMQRGVNFHYTGEMGYFEFKK